MVYQTAFWIALAALAAWFAMRDKSSGALFRLLTLVGLGVMALALGLEEMAAAHKFAWALRDLLLLGVAGLVFSRASSWRWSLWVALGVAAGSAFWVRFFWPMNTAATERVGEYTPQEVDQQGEWLVELRSDASLEALQSWADARQISLSRAFAPADAASTDLDDYYLLNLPNDQWDKQADWAKSLEQAQLIDWLEVNEVIQVAPVEALRKTPDMNAKLGVNDPETSKQWALQALGMEQLYQYLDEQKVKPVRPALVAILDTGVDSKHEDISANFVSTQASYNDDPKGHGTHCAGIAGAVTNNGKGIASWSRRNDFVRITSIKVLNANGTGSQKTIIDGIIAAADRGVDVISMSLGGFSNQASQRAYEQAVAYAQRKGAIVVAAAGNFNRNAKGYAPVNANGVIGVSAIDASLQRAAFSNYVNELRMGLAAPGVEIFSTIPGNQYAAYNGTSMAAPYVSGMIGLLRSLRPSLTTDEVYRLLKDTGKATASGSSTGPLIQPAAAVKRLMGQ